MVTWDDINRGERVELGLVQVDLVGHSQLAGSDRALQETKISFREHMEGIAQIRRGRLFSWAGDGGAFMFRTGTGPGFDDLAFSAMQMLSSLPAINEEIAIRTDLDTPLAVRISCDSGVVNYDDDPGQITADFINRFMKNERSLGISNSISITDRVWKQLTSRLRERFVPFKHSSDVNADIYNYGGKQLQSETLRSLHNIEQRMGGEQPTEEPECVEIVAFAGDTLAELSKEAYGDVFVEGHENVGGLNLLITKNAEICRRHETPNSQDSSTDFLFSIDVPNEVRQMFIEVIQKHSAEFSSVALHALREMSPRQSNRLLRELRTYADVTDLLNRLYEFGAARNQRPRWQDPFEEFEGGESIRFYNCAALGCVPVIGEATLLDHVFAGNLEINRVVGGVDEPVVRQRVFESVDGEYRETQA